MTPAARRSGALLTVAGILLLGALAAWCAARARVSYSTTTDEPDHVRACRELRSGPGVVSNFEHPVLMKLLGAAGLPARPADRSAEEVRAARRLFPFVFGVLAAVSGYWAWRRSGPLAGLAVAGLVAAEPTLRGHAALVHTDVLLAAFLVAAASCLDLSGPAGSPRTGLLVGSGILYGLALVAKYSALPFLPVFLGVAVLRLRRPAPAAAPPARKKGRRAAPAAAPAGGWAPAARTSLLLVGLPALVTALLVQQVVVASTTSPGDFARGVERKFRGFPDRAEIVRTATSFPRGLGAYSAGLAWVRASSVPGARINYFLGEVSGTGWLLYFPVALAVKLTTATVLALLGAAAVSVALLARRRAAGRRRRLRLLAARSQLPALLGLAYLGAAMLANVNIGVRHVAPAVPFLLVAAAGVLRTTAPARRRLPVAVAVVALAAAEAAAFAGREIPFGNLPAGGPAGVRRLLSDSNVDWGERLEAALARASKGDLGRVGFVSLYWDAQAASEAGVVNTGDRIPEGVDALFVSVFLWDIGPPLERSRESGPKWDYFRGEFAPFLRSVRERAARVEPFLDEYLIVRLRPDGPTPEPTR
jgi:hypothetical protein